MDEHFLRITPSITVQDLIDQLMKVVDKTKPIYYDDYHEMQIHPFDKEDVNETNNCVLIGDGNGRI